MAEPSAVRNGGPDTYLCGELRAEKPPRAERRLK